MSSNLQSSLSATQRKAAAQAADALSGGSPAASLNTRGQGDVDNQAFARWMSQYSQSANPGAALASTASPPAAPQPSPGLRESAQKAYQPTPAHHLDVTVGHPATAQPGAGTPAAGQHGAPARPAGTATAKAPTKASTKPTEAPRREAKAGQADKDTADAEPSDQTDEAQGAPVAFTTAQGEATAYVKELQPPAHVAAGDPAAMLAWLSTLAQAKGAAQPTEAHATGGADAKGGTPSLGALTVGEAGGRQAQPSWAVQGATQEQASFGQGADTGTGADHGGSERDGALTLEGLGLQATQERTQAGDAATFGSLMSQALQRTPEGLARQEAAHRSETLPTPLNSPEFPQALADKVSVWVAGAQDGPMTAELRLNPAEMGPVHIRIELDGQLANIDFAAQALETRQAIEASLPMLSEALAQAGLSLSGGGVSDQPQQQAWNQAQDASTPGSRGGRSVISGPSGLASEGLSGPEPSARIPRGRAGGLDLYA